MGHNGGAKAVVQSRTDGSEEYLALIGSFLCSYYWFRYSSVFSEQRLQMLFDVFDIRSMHWVDRPASLKQLPQAVRDASRLRQAQVAIASDRHNDAIEPHAVKGCLARHDLSKPVIQLFVTFMLFLSPHTLNSQRHTRRWLYFVAEHDPCNTPPQATCSASWAQLGNGHMVHR